MMENEFQVEEEIAAAVASKKFFAKANSAEQGEKGAERT